MTATTLFGSVLAFALAACASAGDRPCTIDSDCGDPSAQECFYESQDATGGVCQPKAPVQDAGRRTDGGRADGGRVDGGVRIDGGPSEDGGSAADGGDAADGGNTDDGGMVSVDGGTPADGGAVDGGRVDGGAVADGGVADGGTDGGAPDGGTPLGILEQEPNDTRATAHDLTTRTLPLTMRGAVSSVDDVDFFRLRTTRGTLLRITLTPDSGSTLNGGFAVLGADDANFHYQRFGASTAQNGIASRQVFLPISGDYHLAVYDEATVGTGGAYTLTVVQDALPAAITTSIGTPQSGTLSSGEIKVYGITPAAGPMQAMVVAKQLGTPSNLDTVVTVWDPAAQVIVVEANDGDTPTGTAAFTTDARVAFVAAGSKLYHVIVDHSIVESPGTTTTYRLDTSTVAPEGATTEANDRFSTAYPLTIAQTTYTAAMRSSTATDWDVYSVYLGPSDNLTVSLNGAVTAGSEMFGYFAVLDELGNARRFGIIDSAFSAQSRFYAGLAGMYYVYVTDIRYLAPGTAIGDRPLDAAGTQYRIDLAAETAPTVEPRTTSPVTSTITAQGTSRFFRVPHTGGVLLSKVTSTTADFAPGVGIWEASGASPGRPRTPLAGISTDVVAAGLTAGDYILQVDETFGYTGAFTVTWQSLGVSVAAGTFVGESDTSVISTTNDTCATGDPLNGVPSVGVGTLTSGDVDFYRFAATSTTAVVRTAGYGFGSVDTSIQLIRASDSTVVAMNDDENATANLNWSRLSATVALGQTYCVRVAGKASTDTGDYAVIVTAN